MWWRATRAAREPGGPFQRRIRARHALSADRPLAATALLDATIRLFSGVKPLPVVAGNVHNADL